MCYWAVLKADLTVESMAARWAEQRAALMAGTTVGLMVRSRAVQTVAGKVVRLESPLVVHWAIQRAEQLAAMRVLHLVE